MWMAEEQQKQHSWVAVFNRPQVHHWKGNQAQMPANKVPQLTS
jgi:hypothetical protein